MNNNNDNQPEQSNQVNQSTMSNTTEANNNEKQQEMTDQTPNTTETGATTTDNGDGATQNAPEPGAVADVDIEDSDVAGTDLEDSDVADTDLEDNDSDVADTDSDDSDANADLPDFDDVRVDYDKLFSLDEDYGFDGDDNSGEPNHDGKPTTKSLQEWFARAFGWLPQCHFNLIRPVLTQFARIARRMNLNNWQEALVMVILYDHQSDGSATNLLQMADLMKCPASRLDVLTPVLETLRKAGWVVLDMDDENPRRRMYKLPQSVFDSITIGEEAKPDSDIARAPKDDYTPYIFCEDASKLIRQRDSNDWTTHVLAAKLKLMEDKHANMPFISDVRQKLSDPVARAFYYYLCNEFLDDPNDPATSIREVTSGIYERRCDRSLAQMQISNGTLPAIAAGLVEQNMSDDNELTLTDEGIKLFLGEEAAKPYLKSFAGLTRYEFVNRLYDEIDDSMGSSFRRINARMHRTKMRLRSELLKRMETANAELSLVKHARILLPDDQCRLNYYLICAELVRDSYFPISQLDMVYTRNEIIQVRQEIKDGSSPLIKQGLVELEKGNMMSGAIMSLTDKGRATFLEQDAELFEPIVSDKDLVKPEQIKEKTLFFDGETKRQLGELRGNLCEDKYEDIVKRLGENNLPTGVAALFYGTPGTGKTESALQIARLTGRAVYHVDISQSKSCWFGESEKIIKSIFTNYRNLCKRSKVKPILLFNEADAIFSKRVDVNKSNCAQTENAMQNIILEEMEKLDGILIATTNLTCNLDTAFARRFLFKVRFTNPTVDAKRSIWLDKLPKLSEADANQLAQHYDFSGGEIDNVVRKALLHEVLYGKVASLADLITYCDEERITQNEGHKVGFAC